jgi:TetR/AcrR family transcriptional regulator
VKRENILEAAIKRFSHFGIHKTTLTEIADDLSMSKQSLFYYFPDKQSLITAVEENIIDEYISTLEKHIAGTETVEGALIKLIEIKASFFEKYYMLASQVEWGHSAANSTAIADIRQKLREKELAVLTKLFEQGVQTKELRPVNAEKTGALLLDTLKALAQCVRDEAVVPQPQAFEQACNKQKEVMRLFYNGLKN